MPTDPIGKKFAAAKASEPPRRFELSRNLVIGLIAGVVVLAAISLSVFHYTGPVRTVQSFFNDSYVQYDASATYGHLCADAQAKTNLSQIKTALAALKAAKASYDLSGLTYDLVDENFFGDAHVRVNGVITFVIAGQKQSQPITGNGTEITLHSAGLGWCIDTTVG